MHGLSLRAGVIQVKVAVLNHLGGLSSSTLDGFFRSDVQFLQLPRLLSQFRSIDHEKNISSCIARVAALRGTFENRSVGGATKDPCTLILIWDTGALFGLTPFLQ